MHTAYDRHNAEQRAAVDVEAAGAGRSVGSRGVPARRGRSRREGVGNLAASVLLALTSVLPSGYVAPTYAEPPVATRRATAGQRAASPETFAQPGVRPPRRRLTPATLTTFNYLAPLDDGSRSVLSNNDPNPVTVTTWYRTANGRLTPTLTTLAPGETKVIDALAGARVAFYKQDGAADPKNVQVLVQSNHLVNGHEVTEVEPGEQVRGVGLEGGCEFLEVAQSGGLGAVAPVREDEASRIAAAWLPELTEVLPEEVALVERPIGSHTLLAAHSLRLTERFSGFQEPAAAPLDDPSIVSVEAVIQLAAGFIDGAVDERNPMDGVVHDGHPGKDRLRCQQVRRPHVHGDGLTRCMGVLEPTKKRGQGVGMPALGRPEDLTGLQIEHDRHGAVTLVGGVLVHSDQAQLTELALPQAPARMGFEHALDEVPTDTDETRHVLDRRDPTQLDEEALKGSETKAFAVGTEDGLAQRSAALRTAVLMPVEPNLLPAHPNGQRDEHALELRVQPRGVARRSASTATSVMGPQFHV
ncbi:MAG TPA: hypothetical protein P5234_16565, partial [Thermoanaerobaculaceae bacterium]|nr:hypothetical protein [Thermoanaerobaculaceae bacterium]